MRFTYFVSGVYFLLTADKNEYIDALGRPGKSNIGFGGTLDMMKQRLEQVRLAMKEGHEIGSHAIGPLDGAKYTFAQWDKEFAQFTHILSNVWQRYNKAAEPAGWKNYFAKEVSGFRAPYLAVGDRKALWKTFAKHGMDYDTSLVNNMNYWPRQIDGVWNFPLAMIKVAGTTKTTLSMDYNFLVSQSGGKDGPRRNGRNTRTRWSELCPVLQQQLPWQPRAGAYRASFLADERRRYWRAMQRIARYVKKQPDVICGTYKELLAFVVANKHRLNDYQAGNFDKPAAPSAPRSLAPDEFAVSVPKAFTVSQARLDQVQAKKKTAKSTGCCAG